MKLITKRANGTTRVQTRNLEPSKADQSFKDEVDANNIVNKFRKTRQWQHVRENVHAGVYADLSEHAQNLTEATLLVQKAQNSFMELPAKLRNEFNNSPQEMINFLADPKNDAKAIELGLKIPKQSTIPTEIAPGSDSKNSTGNKPEGRVRKKTQESKTETDDDE